MVLLQVICALQASSYELSVVDESVLITINDLHGALYVLQVNFNLGAVLKPVNKLFDGQLAVTINIYLRENLPKKYDLVFWNPTGDQTQSSSLELHGIHVILHIVIDIFAHLDLTIFFLLLLLDPRMVVCLFSSKSHISLPIE